MKARQLQPGPQLGRAHYGDDYHWGWIQRFCAGVHPFALKPQLECLVVQGRGVCQPERGDAFPIQPGTLLIGDRDEVLHWTLETSLEVHLVYPSAGFRQQMRRFLQSLPDLDPRARGRWVPILVPGHFPVRPATPLVFSARSGPLPGHLTQLGLQSLLFDLSEELRYRIDGPASQRKILLDWSIQTLRYAQSLVLVRRGQAWLWEPHPGGHALPQALAEQGLMVRPG